MVWCNALTEYYNANNGIEPDLDCVYYTDSGFATPHRSSADGLYGSSVNSTAGSFDVPYVKAASKGFRLPGSMEWECAVRYQDGTSWTAGNMVSGGSVGFDSSNSGINQPNYDNFNPYAWYGNSLSSPNGNTITTQPIAGKAANALGLRDMSSHFIRLII